MDKLLKLIERLIRIKWTGQLRLNFHEGSLSKKIEKTESVELNEE